MEFGTMCRMVNLEQMPGLIVPVPLSLTDLQGGYLTQDYYRRVIWRNNRETSSVFKVFYWARYNLPEVLFDLFFLSFGSIVNISTWVFGWHTHIYGLLCLTVILLGLFVLMVIAHIEVHNNWYNNFIKPMIIEFEQQQDEDDPYFMHFTQQRSVQTVAPIFFYTLAALIADVSWSTYLVFICFMVITVYIRLKFPTEQDKKRKEYYMALETYIACHLGLMALKQEGFHMTTCPYPGCLNKHEY